jgi:putative oxidoreductase
MNKKITTAARLLLGLIFFVFGANGFWHFLPITPPPMPEAAITYMTGLNATGYFIPLLGATETICGLLLLIGFAAPLALIILAPVVLNIFLFHFFLTPGLQNLALPIGIVVLFVLAVAGYWRLYRPLFSRG